MNSTAIDVHVHLEHDAQPTDTDDAARKYFGRGVAAHGAQALADYYRSRKMGCVVFTVDEHLTGRPHLTNDEILAFAAANADIVIPFVSVDPTRGAPAVDEARRLVAAGGVRGLKLHPPLQQFFPERSRGLPYLRDFRRGEAAGADPHRSQRHRYRHAGWRRYPIEVRQSDEYR